MNSKQSRCCHEKSSCQTSHATTVAFESLNAIDPLSFKITNGSVVKSVDNTIYAPSTDASDNSLKLVISVGQETTFTPGQLVPSSQAGTATGSILYLNLSELSLSAAELNAITVTSSDWSFQVFADTNEICLTPIINLTIEPSDTITFDIDNFTIGSVPASQLGLYMNFYRVSPISSGAFPYPYQDAVVLIPPPSGKNDLHDDLQITLENNRVVQSISGYPVSNSLTLTFTTTSAGKQIQANENTQLIVGFVYSNDSKGYGALTTQNFAHKIQVQLGEGTSGWDYTPPPPASQNPQWAFTPSNPILSPKINTVQIEFDDIMTTFPSGATTLYVMYSDVPGYEDGSFQIQLFKESHVTISHFTPEPNPAILNQGTASITLNWTAKAKKLLLMPGYIPLSSDTSSYKTTITKDTQFTLLATGESDKNVAFFSTTAYTLPVINSFIADPSLIYCQDFNHDVLLNWDVDSEEGAILSNSLNDQKTPLAPSGTTLANVKSPQMFTITPAGSRSHNIKRNALINPFDVQTNSISITGGQAAIDIAVAPISGLYGLITDSVTIRDSMTNTVVAQLQNLQSPQCLKFSNDGNYLFVCDQSPSLTIYKIQYNTQNKSYTFQSLSTLPLSGTPTDIDILANDQFIFVSSNPNNSQNGMVDVFSNNGKGQFAKNSTVVVQAKPAAIACMNSGAQIFVANSGSQSISVLGYSQISSSFSLVKTITGFASGENPYGIAVSGSLRNTLLVACKETNSLYCCLISDSLTTVSGCQKLSVGKQPTWVESTHEGIYAYVSNSEDSTLSLISCFMDPPNCRVLKNSIPTNNPGKISFSPSDMLFYVANKGNSNLTKGSLITFEQNPDTVTINAEPTSVVVSPKYAVFWHNYQVNIKIPFNNPSPGLFVYEIDSQTVTNINPDTKYISFKFYPDETQPYGFALALGSMNLSLIETDKFTTVTSIPLSQNMNQTPIAMTINQSGDRIFVLSCDSQKNYSLSVLNCDLTSQQFSILCEIPITQIQNPSKSMIFATSDGSKIFIVNSVTKVIYVVEKSGNTYALSQSSYILTSTPVAMTISSDDSYLYIWMNNGEQKGFAKLDIVNSKISNFMLITSLTFTNFTDITISPDNKTLYVVDSNSGVWMFETKSMQDIGSISLTEDEGFPMGIAIAADGSKLYLANALGNTGSWRKRLATQVKSSSQTSLTDSPYAGLFLRDSVGQAPMQTGSGWTDSPDIVPYGTSTLPDATVLGKSVNYNTDYGTGIQTELDHYNNIYVRGKNTTNAALTSRVYFFQSPTGILLWPGDWQNNAFYIETQPQNYLDVTSPANDLGYAGPISWLPNSQLASHFCLVAWTSNDNPPIPPDMSSFQSFKTSGELGTFIMQNPNMAWRNTQDIQDPGLFKTAQSNLKGAQAGGQNTIGVYLKNLPINDGSTIRLVLSSEKNPGISWDTGAQPILTNTFSFTYNWPSDAPNEALLTYTYTPKSGSLTPGWQIITFTSFLPPLYALKNMLINGKHLLLEVQKGSNDFVYSVHEQVLGTVYFRFKP